MKARDVMTAPVISIGPDTPVSDIATMLIERRISGVPVVDDAGRLVGIVSEGDLLRRAETRTERPRSRWLELLRNPAIQAADYVKTHGLSARDVMSRDVISVSPDAELGEIARLLEQRRIKRVPVVENGKPIGIVSRANLLHGLVAYKKAAPGTGTVGDPELRRRLADRLEAESWVDLSRLNVVVNDGVVHLWGLVRSEDQRRALRVAAESVPGVQAVEDHLAHDSFPGTA